MELATAGYGGGDPDKVMQMRADWVMAAWQHRIFKAEYEAVFIEINRGK